MTVPGCGRGTTSVGEPPPAGTVNSSALLTRSSGRRWNRVYASVARSGLQATAVTLAFARVGTSSRDLPVVGSTRLIPPATGTAIWPVRSEEHTSELQSQSNLVCRLLLEKK